MAEAEYPSNSNKSKEHSLVRERTSLDDASVADEKPAKAKGVVTTRPPSTFGAVMKALFPDGIRGIRDHFIWDLFVPGMQNMLYNGWQGLGDLIFKGGVSSRPSSPGRTSYEKAYRPASTFRPYTSDIDDEYSYRVNDFREVIFDSRESAESVLRTLNDMIRQYSVVTLLDYNELVGLPTRPTYVSYGWAALATAYVQRTYDGYRLAMPRPIPIDSRR